MCLAETGVAVDEERVIGLAWVFRDGYRGGVGKLVGAADDEIIKGVAVHLWKRVFGLLLKLKVVHLVSGEDEQVKVTREDIGQHGLDALAEAAVYDISLKLSRRVQHESAVLNIDRGAVREPGVYRGRRELI